MKFLAITLIVHRPDPVTGVQKPTHDRFREALDNAVPAEELGFDGFGVGERHERPFISSPPTVVLSHLAALTKRIRLFTAMTTLSLLDAVRAYEDYATLDHLSEGAIQFPTPEEARAHVWSDADRALVQDRLDTRFAGSPGRVADRLEQLQEATQADELLITTITHDHADRVRSYELLAQEWRRRGHSFQSS